MDYFMGRPGAEYAETILALSQKGDIECMTSSVVLCTIAYLFEKYKVFAKKDIPEVIESLREVVKILPVTDEHISSAIDATGNDFEDNVETACAEDFCQVIITRNIKDFKGTKLRVYKPEDLIKILNL